VVLSVGLVGSGAMGSLHARVLAQHPATQLKSIIDPDPRAAAVADLWACERVPELEDPSRYDAVVVATPTHTHFELASRCLAAGVPVLVEKPLTDRIDQTEELVAQARRRGVPMMCGFLERYNPAVLTARELAREPVHVTTVRHSPYAPRIRTGVIYDLLIHDIDQALRILGSRPQVVDGVVGQFHPSSLPGAEDIVEATLRFDSGAVAALAASRLTHRKMRTLTIHELTQSIEVDMVRNDITVWRHVANELLDEGAGGYRQQTVMDIPAIRHYREPLFGQLQRFVELVTGLDDFQHELDGLTGPHAISEQLRASSDAVLRRSVA
jgi:predicted dehydrogenase